jgi:hypothetical protein
MTLPTTLQRAEPSADPQLEMLLEFEQQLGRRVDAALAEARARLAAAHAEVRARLEREAASFEAQALAESRADQALHASRQRALRAEHAAALQRLTDVPAERIDSLARFALAQAIGSAAPGATQ